MTKYGQTGFFFFLSYYSNHIYNGKFGAEKSMWRHIYIPMKIKLADRGKEKKARKK